MDNHELMARIRSLHGTVIAECCAASSIPEAFVAALIANESNDKPEAKRFEPAVYKRLVQVREGKRKNYGSIPTSYLTSLNDEALRVLATSYGLTQIMGYNAAMRHVDPLVLPDPKTSITLTLRMLAECCEQNGLDPKADFEGMLRWWNSGRVDGKTYDPDYVANAKLRAQIWTETPVPYNG